RGRARFRRRFAAGGPGAPPAVHRRPDSPRAPRGRELRSPRPPLLQLGHRPSDPGAAARRSRVARKSQSPERRAWARLSSPSPGREGRMRKPLVLVAVVTASLALGIGSGASAQPAPLKIGLIVPQSGRVAANGKEVIDGLQLFLEEEKRRLAGREVKLLVEDDESKPPVGLAKAKSLVDGQGVQLLVGPVSAPVGYAMAVYIDARKIPALLPVVAGDDLTQRKRSLYAVRTGWSSSQPSHPFGKWVHDTLKYKKVAMIVGDTAFGWEVAGGFQRPFEEAGGPVVQ